MSIRQELIEYCNNCLSDKQVSKYEDYISGKKHKNAVRRLLRDFHREETNKDYPYFFDDEEAQNIVDWFSLLRHSKGILAGQPIILTTWQKFNLCQLYGWRRKDNGHKRFNRMFIEVGRKNAKSQMLAGCLLYEISVSATKNGESYEAYTTGVKREQSKIIFSEADLMLRGSPLQSKFRVTRDSIRHYNTGSFLKTLSKEDGKKGDGTNIAALCVDEYHQHPTTEFLDLFLGANTKDPTLVIITTAGMDLTYPCYTQEYKYCSEIIDPALPEIENDNYLIDILEVDSELVEDVSNLENMRYWHMANPIRMSYQDGCEKIEQAYKEAKAVPEKMTAFMTKCLNVWVQAKENGYMNMAKWRACEIEGLPFEIDTKPVYVGFDMSAKTDLTSVAFIIPWLSGKFDGNGKEIVKYLVWTHSFIPTREKLQEHILKDKAPYDAWERDGYLTVTNTPIVDQGTVMRYVLEECKKYSLDVQCLCFDPANASKLMMDLSNEGYDVEEVFQSHRHLNEATQGFREQVFCGNIQYLHNPLLNYAMSNAVTRQNNGLIKIDKDATTKRIDPVDASLCAFKLAMYHEFSDDYGAYLDRFLEDLANENH